MNIKPKQTVAQNKLLLLYLLKESRLELSELQLMRIVGELNMMNYFDLKECLFELAQSGHIALRTAPQGTQYRITQSGENLVNILQDEIRHSSRNMVNEYVASHRDALQQESHFSGEYIKLGDSEYRVILKALEKNQTIFEINIVVYSRDEAQVMVDKWQENAVSIYKDFVLRLS